MILNPNNFWNKKTLTLPTEVDYIYERKKKSQDYTIVQKVIGSIFSGVKLDATYFDILKEKVVTAQQMTISETQHRTNQLNSLLKEAKGEGALNQDEDLSDEAIQIQEQINFQSQVKFLQMYFDAYMAPKVSDAEWRLGKVTGTVLATDFSSNQITGGLMYTRSAFSFPFYRQYWEYDWIGDLLGNTLKGVLKTETDLKISLDAINEIFAKNPSSITNEDISNIEFNLSIITANTQKLKEEVEKIDNPDVLIGIPEKLEELIREVERLNTIDFGLGFQTIKNSFGERLGTLFSEFMVIITANLAKIPSEDANIYSLNGIHQKKEYYSTLFFPPYKISPKNGIDEFTQYMNDIYSRNPEASFDIDSFFLRKEGFTYRDPGFKSLSDYINYLQWIIEGTTGIVHTYLTEWDLSLYMQENLLSATINGAPLKLYLNYRIRQDNPLSSDASVDVSISAISNASTSLLGESSGISNGYYTDDRALVFNVAGSAVSKIDFDNNKLWRPSDFPLSVWWLPYLQDRDWTMKVITIEEPYFKKTIPYMDIYDTVSSEFGYDNSKLKDIFKNQDYLGAIMGIWPNFNMKYFSAFYTSPLDGHSDFDIKTYGDLQKVAGADYGVAAKSNKSIDDFIKAAKKEMLLNEGYYGTISSIAGQATRYDYLDGGESSSEKMTMSSMISKRNSKAKEALSDIDLNQPFASGQGKAQDMLASGLNNKVDASSMTNFTGINRFSPALFGGPHGSDYNPNTIQAYFDEKSQLLRNVPRIDTDKAKDTEGNPFRSFNNSDFYRGLNSFYDNDSLSGISPSKGLSYLQKGITIYTIEYAYFEVTRTRVWIDVDSFETPKSTTLQGYFYNFYKENDPRLASIENLSEDMKRGKRIVKKYNDYTKYPYTMNDELVSDKLVYNIPLNDGYRVYVNQKQMLADYIELVLQPFKQYLFHDEPNINWEIIQHKFENYTANNMQKDNFWKDVLNALTGFNFTRELNKVAKKYKPVFILKFWQNKVDGSETEDPNFEKKIREILIEKNRNGKPATLFFLEGNKESRFDTGPESIFKASCSVDYYKDVQENFVQQNLIFFKLKKVKVGESYKYHPFIKVDIMNSELIADDLQFNGFSNLRESGVQNPMHLNSIITAERNTNSHIIQKFKMSNSPNIIYSHKSQQVTESNALLMLGAGLLLGPIFLLAAVVASTVEIIATTKKSKDEDYDENLKKSINWYSSAYSRLSGYGILSQIQGLNPDVTNLSSSYPYRNLLKVSGTQEELLNTKFKDLTFKSHKYILGGGEAPSQYTEQEFDKGLQKALLKLYLRPQFLVQKDNLIRYNSVTLDTPIRNFLSILLTQLSYFKFVKNSLIGENETETLVNLNILYKTLTLCVDRCILKASGLNSLNEKITPDKLHIYYDYWIDQIIQILHGTDIDRQEKKEQIKSELQQKIDLMESTIEVLHPLCLKNIEEWTLNELNTALNYIEAIRILDSVGIVEKFLFGYLRLLYYYRFFFIAKRFNKENGTMWVMRALESVLEFIVPTAPPSGPPPSPSELIKKEPIYNVAFYEIQNSTDDKRKSLINQTVLEPDRITKIYIRVQWCDKDDFERWENFSNGTSTIEVDEVVKILSPEGIEKYAFKPIDGTYTLISKEYLEIDKNIKWNNLHPLEIQRNINDFDTAQWMITWGDSPDLTPIRWNIFGSINIDNLLQYAKESISPDEYVCLMEEGADFWTVSLPGSMNPLAEGFRTKIKIKQYTPINPEQIGNDPMVNLVGPLAYTIYPITQNQERPYPGVASDNPTMFRLGNDGLGGF
jgi:hypothetical protein